MSALAHQRCFNHATREAAARCPSCRHFYCRECVAEHEHRLLCAKCIHELVSPEASARRHLLGPLITAARLTAAVAVLWVLFLVYGQFLLLLPSEFHDAAAPETALEESP